MATVECPSCRTSNPSEALYCSACGAAMHRSDGDDMIGQTVGGRYHLVEKIGQGSAGTLYRAEHVTLRRRMAVKLLHKQLALSDEAVERFRREAITVCEIDNDHIPQVHDFGRTDADQLFFAMEFLDGETLSSVLERDSRVSPERTADILGQIADGLMEAHTLGYVHRDLRPRSIFLTRRRGRQDFVKILDFGLAKLVQPDIDAQRTAMGMTYGDPRYMAPEQARGEAADRRADIYSLGVLGFEMLVGEPPFKGGGTFEVLQKVLDAPVPRVRDRRTDCPPWLESVIRTALAKRPAERFQTVAQLLDALERKQVLANQPPMPMQLTSQQASKLAGAKEVPSAPSRSGAAVPPGAVSSPALQPLPAANATQAMPTVTTGPRTTFPGQGPGLPSRPSAGGVSAQPQAPRMTMSYPAVKPARSATAPGVSEHRPSPEPPALTGESKAGPPSDMRLLGERLPPAEVKSAPARTATSKGIAAAPPVGRAAEPAVKPSVLIAATTPARSDPTPRTAQAMFAQEVMAWEEAALPVIGTTDLTESANLSEPAGRVPSADTPVEEMKFAPGAASAVSPTANPSAVAPRPISAPAIAAMRSMFPGPSGPKSSEPHKAQPAPAGAGEKSASASASGAGLQAVDASKSSSELKASSPGASKSSSELKASSPGASKSSSELKTSSPGASKSSSELKASSPGASRSSPELSSSASAANKSSSGFNASVPGVSKSSPGVSASRLGGANPSPEGSASASGVRRLVTVQKTNERPEAIRPVAATLVPAASLPASERETVTFQRLPEPVAAAPVATTPPAPARSAAPAVAPAESTPFGLGSQPLSDTADDEDSADATIPQIRPSRDDETPIIAHQTGVTQGPGVPLGSAAAAGAALSADEIETAALAKTTGEQAVNLSHDTPKDAVVPGRATGAESNWFSTPAASAADTFATDDNEVAIGRRRVPKWILAVAAGAVLLLGVVYLASRSPTPAPVVTPQPTATPNPAPVVVPAPAGPSAGPPPSAAPTPEVAKTAPVTPGPEVTALPVATAIAPPPSRPMPGSEPTPRVAEVASPEPPTAAPAETSKAPAVTASPVASPAPRPRDKPEAKTKSDGERLSAKAELKATSAEKTNPAAETAKADPDRKGAKAPKEPKEPKEPKATTGDEPGEKAEKKPGAVGALVQNAKKKLEDGEPDAAAALFSRAVELDSRSAEAIGGLGESYFEQGNFEAAARNLGKAARLAPRRIGYQELLVQALYKVGRFKDAADACHKLLKLDPGSAKAKQTLELAEKKLGAASN